MSWQTISYEYENSYLFHKFLLWASTNGNIYFSIKDKSTDSWQYFSGDASHSLITGQKLTAYSSQAQAETNYLTTSIDSNGKFLAILPHVYKAKFIRLHVQSGNNVQIYEWICSTFFSAHEIISGTLEISDQLSDSPLIKVVSSDIDRLKIGKLATNEYGIEGKDASDNVVFRIRNSDALIAGWDFDTTSLSAGNITLDSSTPSIKLGSATDYMTGTGIWMGNDSGTYKLHIGNPNDKYLKWDGTDLTITGHFIGTSEIGATSSNSFTINDDADDVTVQLILDRTTGGAATLSWNGAELTSDVAVDTSGSLQQLATKEYVDLSVTSLGASYYMLDTASGISDYKLCSLSPSGDAETYLESAGLSDNDYIGGWISPVGESPNVLLTGGFNFYLTAEKITGTKTLKLYWEMYERKSDTSETLIATSSISNEVDSKDTFVIPLVLTSDYEPDSGSRIVGKLYASVTGSGNVPTVRIYYRGSTGSRWDIPANSEVFRNIFVPYDGAVKDVDLGSYTLTAPTVKLSNLTDGYVPYHISDASGLANSPIRTDGNRVAIGGSVQDDLLYLNYAPTNDASANGLEIKYTPKTTSTMNNYSKGLYVDARTNIASGVTNTGYHIAIHGQAFHNSDGDLDDLRGLQLSYGNYTGGNPTGLVTNTYGIRLRPYITEGTITNLYDIFIRTTATGGTVTNHWGIYQEEANDNYFAGKVLIGTTTDNAGKLQVLSTSEQLRLEYDSSNYASFTVSSSGTLTLAPTGDFILNPTGNDVYPNTNYDINLGLLTKKFLTLHAAELWVETLVAQNTMATIGGRIVVSPTTELTSDLGTGDTTIYVKHNNLANGDRIYLESNGKVEFMSIDSAPGGSGPYSYTVTRNLDGTGANQWYAGDAVLNTGTTGDGFIDIYSVRGVKSSSEYGPTIVGNVRNSSTYNDWTEVWAVGNLNGLYGYSSDTYGAAFGKYSAADYITIDPSNGIRFFDSGDVVQAQLTSGVWTLGYTTNEHVRISATEVQIKDNTTVYTELKAGTLTLGKSSSAEHITIDTTNGIQFYDSAGTVHGQISAGNWSIGYTSGEHVYITNTAVQIKNGATVYTDLTNGVLTLGDSSNEHTVIDTSGMTVKDGATQLANFGSTVTVGQVGSGLSNVYITSGALQLRNNTTVHVELTSAGTFWAGDTSSTERIQWDSSNGLQIFDSGNNAYVKFPTSGSATIAGWTIGASTLANGSNIVLDASNAAISIKSSTFGNNGIQIQYNSGNPQIYIGDGANEYFKYTSSGVAVSTAQANAITIKNGGGMKLEAGGDITLIPSDTNPSVIVFNTTNGINFGAGSTYTRGLCFWPGTDKKEYFRLGWNPITGAMQRFDVVSIQAYDNTKIKSYYDGNNWATIQTYTDSTISSSHIRLEVSNAAVVRGVELDKNGVFRPRTHKQVSLGTSGYSWDDAWADDYYNAADFYHFDTFDDLSAILSIKPSGEVEEKTGLPLVDDSTLPKWILAHFNRTNEPRNLGLGTSNLILDPDGKPFISLKAAISLSWGAIRQLAHKVMELEKNV